MGGRRFAGEVVEAVALPCGMFGASRWARYRLERRARIERYFGAVPPDAYILDRNEKEAGLTIIQARFFYLLKLLRMDADRDEKAWRRRARRHRDRQRNHRQRRRIEG